MEMNYRSAAHAMATSMPKPNPAQLDIHRAFWHPIKKAIDRS